MNTHRFQAALFDLDGTLLDSLSDIAASMNAVLAGYGFPGHPQDAYKIFVGDGMEMLARRVLPEAQRTESQIKHCAAAMRAEYGRRWADKTRPYAGVNELLQELVTRGIRLAVLSNKPHSLTQRCVETLLPGLRFEQIIGERDGVPKKPDPAGALEIAREMKLNPADFIFVGDTSTDMHTACAAGMYPVGVLWGFRAQAELQQSGAREIIEKPQDLLTLFR